MPSPNALEICIPALTERPPDMADNKAIICDKYATADTDSALICAAVTVSNILNNWLNPWYIANGAPV